MADCWAIIVLSKDQCSHCSAGMPTLVDILEEQGREVIIARVVDENRMACKTTEMEMRNVLDSRLVFKYIPEKKVNISNDYENLKTCNFGTTPYLVYNHGAEILTFGSEKITDNFGGLQPAMSKRDFSCLKK